MRISGLNGFPSPAGRPRETAGPAPTADPAPAPAAPTGTPAPEATARDAAHGLVRAAGRSQRSDIAALRQWINHPDLRSELALPDLTTVHKGRGFEKAVAAYEAAIATPTPPPATDPPPAIDPELPLPETSTDGA